MAKVFDQIKNKLGQKKAWATRLVAKVAQGHLVALTHNLLLIYHAWLAREHGVANKAEDQRRERRQAAQAENAREAGRAITLLRTCVRRATQHSAKSSPGPRTGHPQDAFGWFTSCGYRFC